jgi:hypothetical protein
VFRTTQRPQKMQFRGKGIPGCEPGTEITDDRLQMTVPCAELALLLSAKFD